jgi:hypothetical protein
MTQSYQVNKALSFRLFQSKLYDHQIYKTIKFTAFSIEKTQDYRINKISSFSLFSNEKSEDS